MNPTVLQSVTSPRRTWRELGAGAKLAVYTRGSVQLAIISVGIALLVLAVLIPRNAGAALTVAEYAALFIATAVMIVLPMAVIESRPEFTTAPRPRKPRLLGTAAAIAAVVWVSGTLMYLLGDMDTAVVGLFLVMLFFGAAPLGILPWIPFRWSVTVVLSGVTTWMMWSELTWLPLFFGMVMTASTVVSAWTVNIAKQLDRARLTESALQVSEERLRFSQELHDTLGQRLAAMSVKAELARALAKRGDDRLDGELAELQELARTSVTEMHEVVDGYRAVNLSTEVEGARQLLDSAGVHLEVDGDPTEHSAPMRELSAWLVREGTTNVVRHSSATRVRLAFVSGETESVCMSNDGVTRGIERLSGLAGIRRRAEPLGAELVAERDGSLFHVTLTLKE
ncbi:sensor histidine kinase [Corynebacterium glyciniphilum]|uniref:sensor histidine kinase n=1 Tax=Corynebacterium glyciniphilum TaxID=1404244 RepID=UPI0011AB2CD9|nr:histidine kinase [Corynebacterium glyciniphilum]